MDCQNRKVFDQGGSHCITSQLLVTHKQHGDRIRDLRRPIVAHQKEPVLPCTFQLWALQCTTSQFIRICPHHLELAQMTVTQDPLLPETWLIKSTAKNYLSIMSTDCIWGAFVTVVAVSTDFIVPLLHQTSVVC